jgi:hypothetical protein
MAIPAAEFAKGIHDVSFTADKDRYFTHSLCGAKERMGTKDWAKFKSGKAAAITCPRCFYQGVVSLKTATTVNQPKVELDESGVMEACKVITKPVVKKTIEPAIVTFIPASNSHLTRLPLEEQQRRADAYVNHITGGKSVSA